MPAMPGSPASCTPFWFRSFHTKSPMVPVQGELNPKSIVWSEAPSVGRTTVTGPPSLSLSVVSLPTSLSVAT